MLSTGRTGMPHAMQCDPGRTTDRPLGTRAMQTLKKLPQIAPHRPASTTAAGDVRNARGSSTSNNVRGAAGRSESRHLVAERSGPQS